MRQKSACDVLLYIDSLEQTLIEWLKHAGVLTDIAFEVFEEGQHTQVCMHLVELSLLVMGGSTVVACRCCCLSWCHPSSSSVMSVFALPVACDFLMLLAASASCIVSTHMSLPYVVALF